MPSKNDLENLIINTTNNIDWFSKNVITPNELKQQQLINNLRAEIERLQTELNSIRRRYAEDCGCKRENN